MSWYDQAKAAVERTREASERSLHQSLRLTKAHEGKPLPTGVVYIGRDYGGHRPSVLSNTFKPSEVGGITNAVGLYMRWLAGRVWARDVGVLEALASLGGPRSTLACWCCERPAVLLWSGTSQPATPCHGDVIASMHEALTDEGVLADRSRLGRTTFTRSALLLYGRAFGSHRVLRSKPAQREFEGWLARSGSKLLTRVPDATCAMAAECCNGNGCSRCGGTGFESDRVEREREIRD